jgi:3' terminal RNA ribose 2'-O-methyltransferase Hen1
VTTSLHEQRLDAVVEAVRESGAKTVLDLGCGDGPCLIRLAEEPGIHHIVGIDLSAAALKRLQRRLLKAPARVRRKVELLHHSFLRPTRALVGFDMAILVESIEHIDPDRLASLEKVVFAELAPVSALITTPNLDFNPLLGVPSHRLRHPDHRFEWGRAKFQSWSKGVGLRNGYAVSHGDVAGAHPQLGGASQMAIFKGPVRSAIQLP